MMAESLRDRFIGSALNSCRHFNGIQNKACGAGVPYQEGSMEVTMPCIPKHVNGRSTWACELFEIMSQADAEKEADERLVMVERGTKARHAAKDHAATHGPGKGKGGYGAIACPSCNIDKIDLFRDGRSAMSDTEAYRACKLLAMIEQNKLCVVPPNQETTDWTVYAKFDGEFGCDDEIGSDATLIGALEIATCVIEDTEDVR